MKTGKLTFGQAMAKLQTKPGFFGRLFGAKPYVDPLDEELFKGRLDERLAMRFSRAGYKNVPWDVVLPGSVHIDFPEDRSATARVDDEALDALAKAFSHSYRSPVAKTGERTVIVDDAFNPVAIAKGDRIYADTKNKAFAGIKTKTALFNEAMKRAQYLLNYVPPVIEIQG